MNRSLGCALVATLGACAGPPLAGGPRARPLTVTWSVEGMPAGTTSYSLWLWTVNQETGEDEPLEEAVPAAATSNGMLDGTFTVSEGRATVVGGVALVAQPVSPSDPGPSVLLAAWRGGSENPAPMVTSDATALGCDLADASGASLLRTAAGTGPGGIWWGDAAHGALLDLPALPAGWAWEGWVVDGGVATSTGRFSDPDGPDHDGAGDADPADDPPWPGQDFGAGADLRGLAAWITLEPEPDLDPAPFLPVLIDLDLTDTSDPQPAADPPPALPRGEVDFHQVIH